MTKPAVKCICLEGMPIFEQLQLEEALLRTSDDNFCIINHGAKPAIVMGISGKEELLIEHSKWVLDPVPVIRRFSGGGTVIIDENTLFVTFLFNDTLVPCQIDHVHRYLAEFWQSVFKEKPFRLVENDYVIGEKKTGGNAQYLTKKRWLHHTSFLWDYEQKRMDLLSYPPKTPSYRNGRPHSDFLTTLSNCFTSKDVFLECIQKELESRYAVSYAAVDDLSQHLSKPHRKQTSLLRPTESR